MNYLSRYFRLGVYYFVGLGASLLPAVPVEYYVAEWGDDSADGLSKESAFGSVQRGVEALAAGDTLTLLPGEYFGAVRRQGLGSMEAETLIRALIPGTVVLRGDVSAGEVSKVDGFRYVYVMDFDAGKAQVVHEMDTLRVLEPVASVEELEFSPGRFYQDFDNGRLYLSSTDLRSPAEHHYRVGVVDTHGIFLRQPQRVTIEGISVTGFNRAGLLPWAESSDGATCGIYILNGRETVIRDCFIYFNGRGIIISSQADESGDNRIEGCVAWANSSGFGGPYGGLSLHQPRRDMLRGSVSFLNDHKGINIRVAGDPARRGEGALSFLADNLAWGNEIDMRIKSAASGHVAKRNVALNSIEWFESLHNLLGSGRGAGSDRLASEDTIMLSAERGLDPGNEFADPENFDYRLQPGSRFRGTGPDGADRGPFPYEATIFYVSPTGDDAADGLAVGSAWRTPAFAVKALRPGDTLYIEPGVYDGDVVVAGLKADGSAGVAIRGRGRGDVILNGTVVVEDAGGITFERLNFMGGVQLTAAAAMSFHNCRFGGAAILMSAERVAGLRITHCEFFGATAAAVEVRYGSDIFLAGNLFDNRAGAGISVDALDGVLYSDHNSFADLSSGWMIADEAAAVPPHGLDRRSVARTVEVADHGGRPGVVNAADFIVGGPMGRPLGVFIPQVIYAPGSLRVDGPFVYSIGATSANIEWWSSQSGVFEVRWGKAGGEVKAVRLVPEHAYHPAAPLERFSTFSLGGLEAGTTYQVEVYHAGTRIGAVDVTTLAAPEAPRAIYVAKDGDDRNSGLSEQQALRTLNRAATVVRPGDTVWVAPGEYSEQVWVRVTGEEERPITFRAVEPGSVTLHGKDGLLPSAFAIFNKANIHIDGFLLRGYRRQGTRGIVAILRGRDIHLTRCFADGRARGFLPELVTAGDVDGLLVQNCILINGWGFAALGNARNTRVENNVILRVSINTVAFSGASDAIIRNNIVSDNLAVKRFAQLLPTGANQKVVNNCFFIRWPESERSVLGRDRGLISDYEAEHPLWRDNLVANPRFAAIKEDPAFTDSELFTDAILSRIHSFQDAFTTNPLLIERNIGLQPDAFSH